MLARRLETTVCNSVYPVQPTLGGEAMVWKFQVPSCCSSEHIHPVRNELFCFRERCWCQSPLSPSTVGKTKTCPRSCWMDSPQQRFSAAFRVNLCPTVKPHSQFLMRITGTRHSLHSSRFHWGLCLHTSTELERGPRSHFSSLHFPQAASAVT